MNNHDHFTAFDVKTNNVEYIGFWARFFASLIDTLLLLVIIMPLAFVLFVPLGLGGKVFYSQNTPLSIALQYIVPAVVVILFWKLKAATPGKLLINAKIVDASSGEKLSNGQLIGRYLAYYVSTLPLCLGFFWVAFDKKKQGWHDKLANTVVVRRVTGDDVL